MSIKSLQTLPGEERRREPGESLQHLYTEVCRLISLAYPGPTNNATKIVARDSFLDALNNNPFRVRILEKEPPDVDTTLNIAVRLEAFDGCSASTDQHRSSSERSQRQKEHYSRVVTEEDYEASSRMPDKLLDTNLEERLVKRMYDRVQGYMKQLTQEFRKKLEVEDYSRQKGGGKKRNLTSHRLLGTVEQLPTIKAMVQMAEVQHPSRTGSKTSLQGTKQLRFVRHQINNGETEGVAITVVKQVTMSVPVHTRNQGRDRTLLTDPHPPQQHEPRVQVINDNTKKKSTYLTVFWRDKQYNALLDTGCEVSVIGQRLLPKDIQMSPPESDLYAANRTKIPLLGRIKMDFTVEGGDGYSVMLVVTNAIDEFILGVTG